MTSRFSSSARGATLALACIWAATWVACARQQDTAAVAIDNDDIGGIVTSANGPEAGDWVIAETTNLPTRFAKIVVTDDQGRYLVPDLPGAAYTLWVRGYGLVDSPKVQAAPGALVNLTATVAPNPRAAAQYYPAGYWASLLRIPDKTEFPGTGPRGNGIAPGMKTQAQWLAWLKNGSCYTCHQVGTKATREIPKALGAFPTSRDAWARRIQSGQAGPDMAREIALFGAPRALAMFADWTDRIAAGEVPPAPARPQGVERNVVITQWYWADPKVYMHDQVSTDRRTPTVNAHGPIYGSPELSADYIPVLDPVRHTPSRIPVAPRDPKTPVAPNPVLQPSVYWGTEAIWTSRMDVHNPMIDGQGRVWMTARVRPPGTPDYCRKGSSHPSAKLFPIDTSVRQAAVYDPKTKKLTQISTCFDTHHLMFAEDANNTLYFNGYGSPYLGWIDTKVFDETGDEARSQGWTAIVLDTNGNGRRDAFVEVDQPIDPAKDKRIGDNLYSVNPAPDGSVWGSVLGFPGAIIRIVPGPDPIETALAERYEVPWQNPNAPIEGYSPRGMDVDRNGVAWVALGSGHLGSFDRRKCHGPLNGPKATGQHCPEGWTLYPQPLPQFAGVRDNGSAEGSYFAWVDQFDTLGLGANTPIATGNESDAFLALRDGQWVVLRVPYPMGFYTKWMDGRIDDPSGGWKGRGLWSTVSSRVPFHMETGKGTPPVAMHFQLRPDPLAK
ncbi:MAG: carboxypeptidase regulatory-like domain-containing protein [Acidobacteria bacterium]|nr:carboxypeptidase regulatory-like domain-containing protein [Acidobacteriota bacterium]